MIDLGRPAFHAEGVTFFADHASATTLHYLPDRPRLRTREDGTPELSLLKYRLDPALHEVLGGGVLALTVDLFVDETHLQRLRARAARALGLPSASDVQLVPVSADQGHCELILLDRATRDETPRPADTGGATPAEGSGPAGPPATPAPATSDLVERVLGATQPALFGSNAATFFATLSPEGATLVERAIREGGMPAGVVYQLKTTGLRPALKAEVTARWHDVYKFFEDRFHGGKLLLAVDIGPTVERLAREELISVKIDELVPQDERPAVYQQVLDQVQRYVLEELFKPTLGQAPPAEDAEASALATIGTAIKDIFGFFSFTFSLRQIKRDELKTLTYHLQAARAERLTLAPQGTLSVLLPEGLERATLDRMISEVEPGPERDLTFQFHCTTDFAREGIDRIDVSATYAARLQAFTLQAASADHTIVFPREEQAGDAVSVRYSVHFLPGGAGLQGPLERTGFTTTDRIIVLDPHELYGSATYTLVVMGVPADGYPAVIADLEVRDLDANRTDTTTLRLDATHAESAYTLRVARGARLLARRRLRYIDTQGQETLLDWTDIDPGIVIVGDPLPAQIMLPILASARFGAVVRRLVLELKPMADPAAVATRILTADQPAATWSWAAPRGADRSYEYRVTVHTMLSEVREGQWLPGPPDKLIVGEGIARLRQVEMIFAGKSIADAGYLAAKARFTHQGTALTGVDEQEILIQDTRQPVKWAYPVSSEEDAAYSYQLTFIRTDGSKDERPPVTTTDLLVIVPIT